MLSAARLPHFLCSCALALGAVACSVTENTTGPGGAGAPQGAPQDIAIEEFGKTAAGEKVERYTLSNSAGVKTRLITYGATLTELWVPDRTGKLADVVLGFDDVAGYESDRNQFFGCTVGRVANRIANARFEQDGQSYALAANNAPHHLHGGPGGFHTKIWTAREIRTPDGVGIEFHRVSPSGEEGYPGQVEAWVTYTLTQENELRIDYRATCDAATPVNLTHHSYFNLAGAGAPTVLDHVLQVAASRYTKGDATLIPTGELASVAETPFDFRTATAIGARLPALEGSPEGGYDLNYVIDREGPGLVAACRLTEPTSGRVLEIWTTEPGLQFYSGNFLKGQAGKGGKTYAHRSACCLETQHFPNTPNTPSFPSITLRPGETYTHTIVHRFRVDR
jgi:aldose 1-epimerase